MSYNHDVFLILFDTTFLMTDIATNLFMNNTVVTIKCYWVQKFLITATDTKSSLLFIPMQSSQIFITNCAVVPPSPLRMLTSLSADLTWWGRSACSMMVLTLYSDTPCLQQRRSESMFNWSDIDGTGISV